MVIGLNPEHPRVWRKKDQELLSDCLVPKFKGNRVSLMVWACFFYDYVSELVVFSKGGIGSEKYIAALDATLLPFIEKLFPTTDTGDTITVINSTDYIFMQDNAPCHASQKSSRYFQSKAIHVMKWPANSPDLNPLKNLWRDFKLRFHKYFTDTKSKPSTSKEALQNYRVSLKKVWAECSMDLIHALIESMPRRVQAVLHAKGHHTGY